MKLSNFVGVIAGVLFLALAIGFSADNPLAFVNLPGLIIVLGGTITAILVSVPGKEALAALKQARVVTQPLGFDLQKDVARLLHFSGLWFRGQFKQIDATLEKLDDPFMQRGLQMVRDKQSIEDVMVYLNWKISQYRAQETAVINLFRSMATYAPAFGMVGTLVGLVNMLQKVEQGSLTAMTADMGIALVTTFYGLLLANLAFKPIASKLEQRRTLKLVQLTLIAEGVALIQQNKSPSAVRDTLMNFLQGQDREPATAETMNTPVPAKLVSAKLG